MFMSRSFESNMPTLDQVKAVGWFTSFENNLTAFEVGRRCRLRQQLDMMRRHAFEKGMGRQSSLHFFVSRVHIDLLRRHTHESRLDGQSGVRFAHDMIDHHFDLVRSFPHGQLPIGAGAFANNCFNVS